MTAPDRRPRVALKTGGTVRAWVLRVLVAALAAATLVLLGVEPSGLVIGVLAGVAVVALPRTLGPPVWLLGVVVLVLQAGPPHPSPSAPPSSPRTWSSRRRRSSRVCPRTASWRSRWCGAGRPRSSSPRPWARRPCWSPCWSP
ncbi:hypothetical protein GCM10025875_20860 [Litorihabitans aurantiacus]|uniref:Uncharacterized protein n=1 Tax=Litorihabitans aurantiacus TaxID=1930061 RepID=A0AA38CT59_9MICO|nr:hypothetical protein GCM10025875_20860 [Litorihabitans aurantiacus]